MQIKISFFIIFILFLSVNAKAEENLFPEKETLSRILISDVKNFNNATGKEIIQIPFPEETSAYSLEVKAVVNSAEGRGLEMEARDAGGKGFRVSMGYDKLLWSAPLLNAPKLSGITPGKEYTFRYVVDNGKAFIYQDNLFLYSQNLADISTINELDEEVYDLVYGEDIIGEWAGPAGKGSGKPTEYGWENSALDDASSMWQVANGSGGIRYLDISEKSNPVHVFNGEKYSGRLMVVRYEGNLSSSVFSYPVNLKANTNYEFSFVYEHWNNGAIGAELTPGISTSRKASDIFESQNLVTIEKNTLQRGFIRFKTAEAGVYFLTFTGASGTMFAIGDLSLKEYRLPTTGFLFGKNYNNGKVDMKITSVTYESGAFAPKTDEESDLLIQDRKYTLNVLQNRKLIAQGQSEIFLTGEVPIKNASVDLQSENSWLFIKEVRPSKVVSDYLSSVTINGEPFVPGKNGRVAIYLHGTLLIPHASTFKPLEVYTGENYTGESMLYTLHNRHNTLGNFDNSIKSFRLKRGYMATFANNSDGTGYSRIFIADNEDLDIPVMSEYLYETVSFIRVFKYDWVSKKGWAGGNTEAEYLDCTWRYGWDAGGASTYSVEYVPDKHKAGWPGWDEINNKTNVNHLMGYNEPDKSDQANISYEAAMTNQPEFYFSGLRITSPVTSDFYNGWGEAQYIKDCDNMNYRVDITNVHAYQQRSWWSWERMDDIAGRTNDRPIWITEWNNGANWTSESWPNDKNQSTDANMNKQLNDLKFILDILDNHPKVERYSIYNWVQDCRAMILTIDDNWKSRNPNWENYQWLKAATILSESGNSKVVLTPAGEYYKNNKAPIAYTKANEKVPVWSLPVPELKYTMPTNNRLNLSWNGMKDELIEAYIIEIKKENDDDFQELYVLPYTNLSHTIDLFSQGEYRLKVVAKERLGVSPTYSNVIFVEKEELQLPPDLTAEILSETSVQISWDKMENARTYKLKRSTNPEGPYTIISQTTRTSYTDKNLNKDLTYYYKISCLNYAGEGPDSEILEVKTSKTAIDDISDSQVAFWANSRIYFRDYSEYDFALYSLNGDVLKRIRVTSDDESFSVDLLPGVYILKGSKGKQIAVHKILVF